MDLGAIFLLVLLPLAIVAAAVAGFVSLGRRGR